MKIQFLLLLFVLPLLISGQEIRSMAEVEGRQSLSMSDVSGKRVNGQYLYYAKGESSPYTGILYSKHPNGEIDSWQEYVNGVGQGKWINYYDNGNYKEIGRYEQNRVEGPIQKFYRTGQLKAEGTYKDWRVKVGEWNYYDSSGQLVRTVDYGTKGSLEEVEAYYQRGDIPYSWYAQIRSKNGF